MEMKICEIISFAVSLSIMWAELVAEARRDLWAGAAAACGQQPSPTVGIIPGLAGLRAGPACLVTATLIIMTND